MKLSEEDYSKNIEFFASIIKKFTKKLQYQKKRKKENLLMCVVFSAFIYSIGGAI
jgi:hypothetical protein